MMKKILFVVLALGAIGAGVGFYLFNKTVPSLNDMKTDFSLSATELYDAFDVNEAEANKTYLGKIVEVRGVVDDINQEKGNLNVNLESGANFGLVSCKMDSTITELGVAKGEEITLKCQCTGFLMDVVLNRCVIAK